MNLDHFLILLRELPGHEVECKEEVDSLIGEARRRQDRSGPLQAACPVTGLFLEFARRAVLGSLARVEFPGGDFPDEATRCVPVLAQKQDPIR